MNIALKNATIIAGTPVISISGIAVEGIICQCLILNQVFQISLPLRFESSGLKKPTVIRFKINLNIPVFPVNP